MSASGTYIDFSIFESDSFNPYHYCNTLILATNDKEETSIDLTSAENKLKFDIEEVQAETKKEIESNWEQLLESVECAASTKSDIAAIETSLENAAKSYDRLAGKGRDPYLAALPLYDALVHLGSTTSLLRAANRYLQLLGRLDMTQEPLTTTNTLSELDKCLSDHTELSQLRIVISNIPKLVSRRDQVLRDTVLNISSFKNLSPSIEALHRLDRSQLIRTIRKTVHDAIEDAGQEIKTGLEVTPTIRRLQHSDNSRATLNFLNDLRQCFDELKQIAVNLTLLEDALPKSIQEHLLEEVFDESRTITSYFWREVAVEVGDKVREAARGSQWVARTLRGLDVDHLVQRALESGTIEYSVLARSMRI